MFGFGITSIDWLSWLVAIAVTIYVVLAKNPFGKGTREYQALWLCRIALVLMVWSFRFSLLGFALAIASFLLASIAIVKGRTLYGFMLIIGCICVPILTISISYRTFTGTDSHAEYRVDEERTYRVRIEEPVVYRQKIHRKKVSIPDRRETEWREQFVDTIEEHYWKLVSLLVEGKTREALQILELFKKYEKLDYKDVKEIYKEVRIDELERKVKPIPASQALANLEIYEQLLNLDPDNTRYKKKVAYYSAIVAAKRGAAKES